MEASIAKRRRNVNFQPREVSLLTSLVGNYKCKLDGTSGKVSNEQRNLIWEEIADQVSRLGHAIRTKEEVKNKWFNLQREAKDANRKFNKEMRQTGGGPPAEEPSATHQEILKLFADDTAFVGISGGRESSIEGFKQIPMHVPIEAASVSSVPSDSPDVGFEVSPVKACDGNRLSEYQTISSAALNDANSSSSAVSQSNGKRKMKNRLTSRSVLQEQQKFCRQQIAMHDIQMDVMVLKKQKLELQIDVLRLLKKRLQENDSLNVDLSLNEVLPSIED